MPGLKWLAWCASSAVRFLLNDLGVVDLLSFHFPIIGFAYST